MKRFLLIPLLILAACKEDVAAVPEPVEMTEEALGYYCQMALVEHDGPKGQAHLEGMPAPIFFSQVRDVIAYLHMPEQSHAVAIAYVQDMTNATWEAPGAWMPAREALYVAGSDAIGGMGASEFVPFSDKESAEAFVHDHGGRIVAFADIRTEDVLGDAAPAENSDSDDINARLEALGQ
ncbi:nitrous oxide reductase accessory protein NosL [Maritimibacter dapengensis]|uniref:Nitrous oxide reductase accessory protein NosL n=1 Tax=Maritimibacter dapengensis TaxID=2836868 RepID=A0ABS6T111_9RHOB|nr:nitrous oxide reductase accessory protein NosL [Maritimibacter dapengensis]MBV7378913.1 nitrous oxide reductase accessory protein NosL [Maritimibacter dapengensis]